MPRKEGNYYKHGHTVGSRKTPEYSSWHGIKARCYKPHNSRYSSYGGRGITMCDRWINSFENFLEDMGSKPTPKHSIDRIDVNGNYEPSNCRWATMEQQMLNKQNSKVITYKGVTLPLKTWATKLGVRYNLLRRRIFVYGWDIEKAFHQQSERYTPL